MARDDGKTYSGRNVRQGEIILRHRVSRAIVLAVLVGLSVAVILTIL
jgi:hypothetical protein